ncbi:hypothetical protein GGR93_001832 [Sulfitobacter noctilucicola]|uniref:Uncharacterized protein n=1 Tax=Sulfitobacter noctilucicola TaxID=1342301 RepID=A0A7W6M7W4_9RHOB|nr:hypothetical protein [Sulfitobacter noctilucicola]
MLLQCKKFQRCPDIILKWAVSCKFGPIRSAKTSASQRCYRIKREPIDGMLQLHGSQTGLRGVNGTEWPRATLQIYL